MLKPLDLEVVADVSPSWDILQLIPFRVTDSNGNPRVGVPVALSVYSITSLNPEDVTIDFLVPPVTEPSQQTITTDSAGQGVFNVVVNLRTPPLYGTNAVNVVFKAVTDDPVPVTAYVGNSYSIKAVPPPSQTPEPAP